MIPFPSTDAFKEIEHKLPDTDIYDPEELKNIWIEEKCSIDLNTINHYVDKILELGQYKITIRK